MKNHFYFQNNNNGNAGLRMSLASVKYGIYAHLHGPRCSDIRVIQASVLVSSKTRLSI